MARGYTGSTFPKTPEEFAESLSDPAVLAKVFPNSPNAFQDFTRAYQANMMADGGIQTQIAEQTQAALAEFLKANGASGAPARGVEGRSARSAAYNKAAPGAAVESAGFTSMSQLLAAVSAECGAIKGMRGGQDLIGRLTSLSNLQNSQSTNAPGDGGFLVPESFRSDLLMVTLERGIIRPRATVIPMTTQRTTIPAADATSNVSSLFGGITCTWVDESTQPTETSAKFQGITLDAKKLMAYLTAPNELVADAPAFGAFLDTALPMAMAFEEDYKFMTGNGAGEPLGFINCPAAVITAAVSGQGANTIIVDNLAAMFARMLPSSLMNAIWVASIDTFPQLALMAVQGTLGNTTPVWMNNGVQGTPPISIYGRPVYFTEKCSALGTTGDINFIDPAFYLIGDRQTMQVSASPHFAFNVDKTAYKVIERLDGRPWLSSAITPRNNGSTVSPFVQLSGTRT